MRHKTLNYTIFGPFNLDEARALSTSYPWECLPWAWGDRTHLESAGRTAITNAGIVSNTQRSLHGRNESTILYKDINLILCQIEKAPKPYRIMDYLEGYYIIDSKITESFLNGFKILIKNKKEANSELNKFLRKSKTQIKQKIKEEKNITEKNYLLLQKINESKILEEPDYEILENLSSKILSEKKRTLDENMLIRFLKGIYIRNTDMPNNRLGSILYHLGHPVNDYITKAIDESIQLSIFQGPDKDILRQYYYSSLETPEGTDKIIKELFGFD